MHPVSPAGASQSPPVPIPAPRSSRPSSNAAPAPLGQATGGSGANPMECFNASMLVAHPQHRQLRHVIPNDQPRLPGATQYRLQKHEKRVEEHLAGNIPADRAICNGDIQNLPTFIDYMNKEHAGLDLHYADSTAALADALDKAPETFHLRFIFKDQSVCPGNGAPSIAGSGAPSIYYGEFVQRSKKQVSGWILTQIAFGGPSDSPPMLFKLSVNLVNKPRFTDIRLIPVHTYNQANPFDAVMFAAHAAWTAHDNQSTFKALHARVMDTTQAVDDFGIVKAGKKQPIFCDSYYEHQQTESGVRTADSHNSMSIFHFRRQLIEGALAMQQAPEMQRQAAYAAAEKNRTMPSVPMRRSSAPSNQS